MILSQPHLQGERQRKLQPKARPTLYYSKRPYHQKPTRNDEQVDLTTTCMRDGDTNFPVCTYAMSYELPVFELRQHPPSYNLLRIATLPQALAWQQKPHPASWVPPPWFHPPSRTRRVFQQQHRPLQSFTDIPAYQHTSTEGRGRGGVRRAEP